MWKAKKEEYRIQISQSPSFACNPYNRNCAINAAGQEARYLERVEILIREELSNQT